MDDGALLRAAARGDADAFERFMLSHDAAVHRFLRAYVGSAVDVDDALQDTFISAWRGAGTFGGGASARGWLMTIARNTVRHQVRRRVDEPAHFEPIESVENMDALATDAGWGRTDEASSSDASVARDLLEEAFAQLPASEREILTLRELDGLSGDETAEVLQLSLTAMKSRLHRARLHLAAVLHARGTSTTGSVADVG